jgi:hypothetical protein
VARIARLLQALNSDNCDQLIHALAVEYQLLNDHQLRVTDQLNASLAKKDITAMKKQVEQLGLSFSADELQVEGKLFGWAIHLSKAG